MTPDDLPPSFLAEAELGALAAMLLDDVAAGVVAARLCAEDFSDPDYRTLFGVIAPLVNGHAADPLQVAEKVENKEKLRATFLHVREFPTAVNAELYCSRLKDATKRRRERDLREAVRLAALGVEQDLRMEELARFLAEKDPPKKLSLVAWDFTDTMSLPEPAAPEMFVDRLFVRDSVNVIFGPPASGKSFGIMDLVVDAVTTGGFFLGGEELRMHLPGDLREERCLWIFGDEDTEARVRRRLKKIHGQGDFDCPLKPGGFVYATTPDGVRLNSPEGWAWLDAMIEEFKPTLLVLDTITSLCAQTLDVNKAEQVVPFMGELLRRRREKRLTIFAVHHTSKPAKDAARSAVSKASSMLGSQAFLSLAESVVMFDAVDGDTSDVKIRCVKTKDVADPIPTLRACLDRDTGRFHLLAEDEAAPVRDVVTKAALGAPKKFSAEAVLALRPRFPDGVDWNLGDLGKDLLGIGKSTWHEKQQAVSDELLRAGCWFLQGRLKWPTESGKSS